MPQWDWKIYTQRKHGETHVRNLRRNPRLAMGVMSTTPTGRATGRIETIHLQLEFSVAHCGDMRCYLISTNSLYYKNLHNAHHRSHGAGRIEPGFLQKIHTIN